jgi:Fe-S cluster biogenesis protein NfuA
METAKKYIEVYSEATPNPSAMKFVVNKILLNEGVVEYLKKEDAQVCPLAYKLFDFAEVKSVFITANFITITKSQNTDWYEILGILREFIKNFFISGEKLFLKNPFELESTTEKNDPLDSQNKILNTEENNVEEQIKQMLDDYVRPAVEQDGGAIHFKSYEEGVVTLILKGSCSGCPSSMLTLKSGIENLLKKMVPGVTEVLAEEG